MSVTPVFDLDANLEALQRRNQELEERARAHLAIAETVLQQGRAQLAQSPTKPAASFRETSTDDIPTSLLHSPSRAAAQGSSYTRPATSTSTRSQTSRPSTARSPKAADTATQGSDRNAASVSSPGAAPSATPRSRPASAATTAVKSTAATAGSTPRTPGRVASALPSSKGPAKSSAVPKRGFEAPKEASSDPLNDSSASIPLEFEVPGNPDVTIRLQRARIKAQERELQEALKSLGERAKVADALEKEARQLRSEKALWEKSKAKYESTIEKTRREVDELKTQVEARDRALQELSRTGDRAVQDRAKIEQEARQRDIRLNRALEEVEKYKRMLEEVRLQEREGKEVNRGEYDRVVLENKKLTQHKQELLLALRKQMRLIDVLKRQKIHLEAARMLAFTEEEFLRVIDSSGR